MEHPSEGKFVSHCFRMTLRAKPEIGVNLESGPLLANPGQVGQSGNQPKLGPPTSDFGEGQEMLLPLLTVRSFLAWPRLFQAPVKGKAPKSKKQNPMRPVSILL